MRLFWAKTIQRKEPLRDGAIRIYNTEQYSDDFKRHAYFYYDMLYRTSTEYIKFIEESFEPTDCGKSIKN